MRSSRCSFAREYGGLLDNRSFGGAQVSRTFYARGQTGQQLLLGAYSALSREVQRGNVKLYTRYEMLDVVLIKDNEGVERARGIIARNLVTGKIERFAAHAVVIGTGGYGNTYFLSTNAMASNGSAAMQVYRKVLTLPILALHRSTRPVSLYTVTSSLN